MAGRVERRINDKLYFVLDEVGGSSDCESESASDFIVKPTKSLEETECVMVCSNVNSSEGSMKLNYLEQRKHKPEENNCSKESVDISSQSLNLDETIKRKKIENSTFDKRKDTFPLITTNNSQSEESSAVVDMDIDSDVESLETRTQPLLRITFRDEATEKRLKASFFKFISQKLEDCTIITSSENNLEIEVYDKDPRELLEDDVLDFHLDTTPGDNHEFVPNYGKNHDLVLSDAISKKDENKGKLQSTSSSCFNCLGNHNLRDCPKPKDFRVINKNRVKFQSEKEKPMKNRRYHLDESQKFGHLMPGCFSKKLRSALNLKKDQLPGFIYRMRLLGYPPAWLEEAKVSHSGVAMYDDIGVPVLEEDEEEGEIIPEGSKDKYDITKIIEFPGFNMPLPSGYRDESKYYQCPALSVDQSKNNLIKLLEPKTVQAYVKKSLTNQKSEEKSSNENELKRPGSPTIEEMEEKKRQLLMELNNDDSIVDPKPTSMQSTKCLTPISTDTNRNQEIGAVKNLEFGTPVLKSVSSFAKLPTREQFSCNVSNVINFENLPNSTGKYETMREVISKIRISTSKSQKE